MNSPDSGLVSWLFVPANRPDRFARAAQSGAAVVIFDLEDAVAPADKTAARAHAITELGMARPDIRRALRINALGSRTALADIAAVLESPAAFDFLLLPKAESPRELSLLDSWLGAAGHATRLIAQVESAAGVRHAADLAQSVGRLAGLLFGAADMSADLGCANDWEPLLHARAQVVAACAPNELMAIDSPYFDIGNADGLRVETLRAGAMGFVAKAAIHPVQINAIATNLTPAEAAIEQARRILAACAHGVGVLDGKMIDEAMARQARRVLRLAGRT